MLCFTDMKLGSASLQQQVKSSVGLDRVHVSVAANRPWYGVAYSNVM